MGKGGVLVTGSSGFIGGHLVERLLEENYKVYVLDSQPHKKKREQLISLQVDITDKAQLEKSCQDLCGQVEVVVHLAAVGNQPSISEELYQIVNVDGTINVFKMTHTLACPYFIFASSVDAVGPVSKDRLPLNEFAACHPINPYGRSKLEAERKILELSSKLNIKACILRFGNVYGIDSLSFIRYIADALKKRDMYFLTLTQNVNMWHPVFVDDLIDAITRVIKKKHFYNQVYYITGHEQPTNGYLMEIIAKELDYTLEEFRMNFQERVTFLFRQMLSSLIRGSLAKRKLYKVYSNHKAVSEIDFAPTVSLEEGIPKVICWAKEQNIL